MKVNKLTVLLFIVALSGGAVSSRPAQGQIASLAQKDAPTQAENDGFVQGGAGYFAAGLHFPGLQLPGRGTARFFSVGGSGYGVVGGRLLIGGAGHRLLTSGGGFGREGVSAGGNYGLFTVRLPLPPDLPALRLSASRLRRGKFGRRN